MYIDLFLTNAISLAIKYRNGGKIALFSKVDCNVKLPKTSRITGNCTLPQPILESRILQPLPLTQYIWSLRTFWWWWWKRCRLSVHVHGNYWHKCWPWTIKIGRLPSSIVTNHQGGRRSMGLSYQWKAMEVYLSEKSLECGGDERAGVPSIWLWIYSGQEWSKYREINGLSPCTNLI